MSTTTTIHADSPSEPTPQVSILDHIMSHTRISQADEAYAVVKHGVGAFVGALLAEGDAAPRADKHVVDAMIAEIDRKVSSQIDEILHHPSFQRIESAWRALRLVVDRADARENTVIHVLDVSKEALRGDFDDAPEVVQSGLYKLVYSGEFGQFGGEPYAAMIADYEFGPGHQDVSLLGKIASVASMAHAPFIAAAGPGFFGIEDFQRLPNLNDLKSILEGPQCTRWRSF